jgi:branched-chain amino acid transport system substrate-binding protein
MNALGLAGPSLGRTESSGRAPENEIVIGTHVDLSGPLASWGAAVRNGLTMAFAEANQAGGINGHHLRLVVRDDIYDPDGAAKATRALIGDDKVFAILSPLGVPTSRAAMNEALSRGVPYLFPIATEEADRTIDPLAFSLSPTHAMEIQEGLRRLLNAHGNLKVGVLASNDEFGRSVSRGAASEVARRGAAAVAAEVTFSHDETQFDTALEKLRDKGTELVVLGTQAQQALQVMRTVVGTRWRPIFLCSSACYVPEFAILAGPDAEGLYGVGQIAIPYQDDPKLGAWARRYETEFSSVATVQALTAYRNARLFLAVLRQSGPQPTSEGFIHMLETRGTWTDPVLGGLPVEFSATDHLGSHTSLLAQIRKGRWTVLTDPLPSTRH